MNRLLILLVLPVSTGFAMDPPDIEWIKLYEDWTKIKTIIETNDGGYVTTVSTGSLPVNSIFKLDQDGNVIWTTPTNLYAQNGSTVIELDDGSLIVAGYAVESQASSIALMLAKYDSSGAEIWTRIYDWSDSADEYARSVCQTPDGGYGICGFIDPPEGMDIAWILRTDSQGDTLWTREWGYTSWATAVEILYLDNGLTVFAQGNTPSTPGGPHLLRYDMDGNLLWETDFPDWPAYSAQAMCEASDGGLLLMDNYWPRIVHTSYTGEPEWWFWPPGGNQPYSSSLSTTMDGGILYSGDIRGEPDSRGVCGVIARFDSHGEDLWHDFIYDHSCDAIYSATQLSQGGYIAAGRSYISGSGYRAS